MQLSVTCRHESVGEGAREYAEGKASRLSRYFDNLQKIEVILDGGKDHRYSAELIVSAPRGNIVVCHADATTATAAFDEALDKMERQLKKLKEKMRAHSAKDAERATKRMTRRGRGAESMMREDNTGEHWW